MTGLLKALERWTAEAAGAGRAVRRVALTYEAGRDGFWIARDLLARGGPSGTTRQIRPWFLGPSNLKR